MGRCLPETRPLTWGTPADWQSRPLRSRWRKCRVGSGRDFGSDSGGGRPLSRSTERDDGLMRIEIGPGEAISNVYIWPSRVEASELRDSLDQMLHAADPEHHEHISSADHQTEITVCLERT